MKHTWHSYIKDVIASNLELIKEVDVDEYQEF